MVPSGDVEKALDWYRYTGGVRQEYRCFLSTYATNIPSGMATGAQYPCASVDIVKPRFGCRWGTTLTVSLSLSGSCVSGPLPMNVPSESWKRIQRQGVGTFKPDESGKWLKLRCEIFTQSRESRAKPEWANSS